MLRMIETILIHIYVSEITIVRIIWLILREFNRDRYFSETLHINVYIYIPIIVKVNYLQKLYDYLK